MTAYIYQAALLCEACARLTRATILNAMPDFAAHVPEDSDKYPVGPYSDGGGEADSPQHCDRCREFLENPLTTDGATYVRDAFCEYVELGKGRLDVLREWAAFYDYAWDDFESITLPAMRGAGVFTPSQEERLAELSE